MSGSFNFLVDSRFRGSAPSASDFIINPKFPKDKKVTSISIHSVDFFNTIYNIKQDTLFRFNGTLLSDGTPAAATILFHAGFWSLNSIINWFSDVNAITHVNGAASTANITFGGWIANIDADDGTFFFDSTLASGTLAPGFTFVSPTVDPTQTTICQILGLWPCTYEASDNTSPKVMFAFDTSAFSIVRNQQESPNVACAVLDTHFHIVLSFAKNVSISSAPITSDASTRLQSVTATPPLSGAFSTFIHFEPPHHTHSINLANLDRIYVTLVDWKGNVISLNGSEWSMRMHVDFR